jgi:preprotein translocase subunit SecA
MFSAMMDAIKEESVGFLFNLEVQTEEPPPEAAQQAFPTAPDGGFDGGAHPIGLAGEPVPSGAPAAFTEGVEPQAPQADERQRVADVLGQALGRPNRPTGLQYTAPSVDGEGGVERRAGSAPQAGEPSTYGDVARNAPCPCGSGRKYKRCHGAPANR